MMKQSNNERLTVVPLCYLRFVVDIYHEVVSVKYIIFGTQFEIKLER